MPSAKMTSKGQVTIPIEVRTALGLEPGVLLDFYQIGDEEFAFTARNKSIQDLKGILPKLGYVPTIEEMNEAVLDAVAESYLAGMSKANKGKNDEAA